MPPIELGPARPVGAVDMRQVRNAAGRQQGADRPDTAAPAVTISDARDPGPVPIDAERVALIRKAVESGTYPIVPAKVADEIIAAGLLLRKQK